jgi:glucokinase
MKAQGVQVGVDVGGTNIKFGIVDNDGRILFRRKTATEPRRGSDAILASIVEQIEGLLREAGRRPEDVSGIGLGVPGTADSETGTVVYAPNLFWTNVAVAPAMHKVFSSPVCVAQDTRAAAWGEYQAGAARGARSIAAVTLGTGIGCGMVMDGKIFHGALNTAGEFGHQIVEIEGEPCNCGRFGCLEAHAGGLAIVREAKRRIPGLAEKCGKSDAAIGVDDVYALALVGDPQARELAESVVRYIGVGLVNLLNLTSVEMICISGGISNAPAELLRDPLFAFVRKRAYTTAAEKVQLCRSALGEDAPLIGAALLYRGVAQAASNGADAAAAVAAHGTM